jgi:hypothetical protein
MIARSAHADPRKTPLRWDITSLIRRATNAHRLATGAGISTGWRPLLDLAARYYATDPIAVGARLRFDVSGAPQAGELELSYVFGNGKMMFPGPFIGRIQLAVEGGGGLTSGYAPTAFGGLALRIQPQEWLMIEAAVRESWVALADRTIARSAQPIVPATEHSLVPEVMATLSVLWPFARYECVWR